MNWEAPATNNGWEDHQQTQGETIVNIWLFDVAKWEITIL